MDIYDQNIEDYVAGFNHAIIVSEFAPEAMADSPILNDQMDDYAKGFTGGKEFIEREQEQSNLSIMEEMEAIRDAAKQLDKELER